MSASDARTMQHRNEAAMAKLEHLKVTDPDEYAKIKAYLDDVRKTRNAGIKTEDPVYETMELLLYGIGKMPSKTAGKLHTTHPTEFNKSDIMAILMPIIGQLHFRKDGPFTPRELEQKPRRSSPSPTEGGAMKTRFQGRTYTVRTGPRGGRYIVVKGQPVYMR